VEDRPSCRPAAPLTLRGKLPEAKNQPMEQDPYEVLKLAGGDATTDAEIRKVRTPRGAAAVIRSRATLIPLTA
jgi:hypothetical protein